MATELVDQVKPKDLMPLNGIPSFPRLIASNSGPAVPLRKGDTNGYSFLLTIPANLTIATGLTFKLDTVDDGKDAGDLGKVIVRGVTWRKVASGTDNLDIATGAGTEQTSNVTMNATSGVVVTTSIAVANANLGSAGAGDRVEVRVRRIGTSASDTCNGQALLCGVY